MFVVDCPAHGGRTILSLGAITRVEQSAGRIDVHLRCWCGGSVVHHTGRSVRRRNDGADLAV